MLARTPASQLIKTSTTMNLGLTVFLFCMTSPLRNAGLVDQTDQSMTTVFLFVAIALDAGRQQQPVLVGVTLGVEKMYLIHRCTIGRSFSLYSVTYFVCA